MSSKRAEKEKVPRESEGAPVPAAAAAKRRKTMHDTETHISLLLETQPEILRKVYSFLRLKEALVLCRTHRQFNEARNDIFQYSLIMCYDDKSVTELVAYKEHERLLCNLPDCQNLRAVLRNDTLAPFFVAGFIDSVVEWSSTDNGQAVSILLEDERCKVDIHQLQKSLRKEFIAIAAVLANDERVKKYIQYCGTCSDNIGCYKCTNYSECVAGEGFKYCCQCVKQDDRFCQHCLDYLCPTCHEEGAFDSCEECNGIQCYFPDCVSFLETCPVCQRSRCYSCMEREEGNWIRVRDNDQIFCCCPSCTPPADTEIMGLAAS